MSELAKWFVEQCNGDWEHSYGIKIHTISNPGWFVEVDLSYTTAEFLDEKGKEGSIEWQARLGVLCGFCGPFELDALLSKLASVLRSATPPNEQ